MAKRNLISILIIMDLFFFLLFAAMDFHWIAPFCSSNVLKYLTTVCAFLISMQNACFAIQLGLGITLVCDYLLLFTDHFLLGIFLFMAVHLCYICHNYQEIKKSVFFSVFLTPSLLISAAFYASIILLDAIFAWKAYRTKQSKGYLLFFLGVLFFIGCDSSIALYHLTKREFFSGIIWLFYTPSQLLISLSHRKQSFLEK